MAVYGGGHGVTGHAVCDAGIVVDLRPMWASTGSMMIGRHLFDMTSGWAGSPPMGEHVVVVSHRPEPGGWHPEGSRLPPGHSHPRQQAPYYFVGDVAQAVAQARELAGERTVVVTAGDIGGQALAPGLVDEVAMDVLPVVFGSGKRFFGSVDAHHLLEDPDPVIQGNRVLHLRYKVARRLEPQRSPRNHRHHLRGAQGLRGGSGASPYPGSSPEPGSTPEMVH